MKFKTILPILLTVIGVSSLSARYRTGGCSTCVETEVRANNNNANNNNNESNRWQREGSTLRTSYNNMRENVDTAYNNPFSSQRYNTSRTPRTGYNSGFSNYNKSAYDADYSSGY